MKLFTHSLRLYTLAFTLLFSAWVNAQTANPNPSVNEVFKIAFSAYQQGNYDLALKNYDLALQIDQSKSYLYYNRALCLRAMGNVSKAVSDFRLANDLKPTAEAYYQIGLVSYEKGDLEAALEQFEAAKLIKEDVERMNFLMGMIYYRNNRFEESLKCFYTFTDRVKNYADAYYYRGLSEAKVGRYADAIVSFKFAMMYKNNDWKLYYKMYEIYLAMNDKKNALYSLSMVIELGEKKADFYEERARLYLDIGDTFKYEEDLATAKSIKASTASLSK
ncbi:MAG: tetratricopeptide repeat protein [Bacteroidetes bacterium]|nr:tetratricopeptide repeat protein [Bacteroidota bacterium]MBK8657569.1 tetratricopeptide repeat protein [Bacteroidota bacterium]